MELKVFVIIGSGVFGASTALHLVRTKPQSRIILIDKKAFPDPSAASSDLNKIIRTEYDDLLYMRLALKARKAWKEDPLYAPFFHEAAMVTLEDSGVSKRVIRLFKDLSVEPEAQMLPVQVLQSRYGNLLDQTALEGVEEVYVNPLSGWAEASAALDKVIEAAIQEGIELVKADITQILFNAAGDCTGVRAADGQTFEASHVILATGPGSIELIAGSEPQRVDFRIQDRVLAAAVVSGVVKLNAEESAQFDSLPIFVHDLGDIYGEVLPPTKDGYLKFASETPFKNTVHHAKSGQTLSIPPSKHDHKDEDSVPPYLENECSRIFKDIFGTHCQNLSFESYRICWDAYTPDEDFIVSPHPNCQGLYFATAGSFHSWKFLPILGELVGSMIDGTLDAALAKRWAWDRKMPTEGGGGMFPKREWCDIVKGE